MAQVLQQLKNPPKTLDQAMNDVENKIKEMTKLIDNLAAKLDKEGDKVSNTQQGARNQILLKYYKYVTYLRNILNAKQTKDKKIINLTKDVFENTNNIIGKFDVLKTKIKKKKQEYQQQQQTIDKLEENKKIKEKQLHQKQIKAKKDYALININIGNKTHKFNADGELEGLENTLKNCTDNIQEGIQGFSNSLNTAFQGGANNNNIVNGHKFNKNSNISEGLKSIINSNEKLSNDGINKGIIESHKNELKEIKRNYEQGLDENIEDFRKICEALRELNNVLKEQFKIKLNFDVLKLDDNEIKQLEEDITSLDQQITDVKDKGFIMYGLDTEKLNIGDIFKNNKEAINALNTKIKDFKRDINTKKNELTQLENVELKNIGQVNPDPGQQVKGSLQGQPLFQLQKTDNPEKQLNQLLNSQKKIKDDLTTASSDIVSKLTTELLQNELEVMKLTTDETFTQENVTRKNFDVESIKIRDEKYNLNYNIDDENSFEGVVSDMINHYINVYILRNDPELDESLLRKLLTAPSADQDGRQEFINTTVSQSFSKLSDVKKNKIIKILELSSGGNEDKARTELIKLYEGVTGGKYKMKKSKKTKSKSKASKTTSKKAKAKENKNKVKSYSKSKSKKQSGGFIRGGVLFPQDFYDTSTVM